MEATSAAPQNATLAEHSYEQLVSALETCVRELEDGRLPLERAIERFKEGVSLVKLAEQRLQIAEGQVNLLLRGEDGQERKEPFSVPAASEPPRGPRLTTSAGPEMKDGCEPHAALRTTMSRFKLGD